MTVLSRKSITTLTEADAQNILFQRCARKLSHEMVVPNVTVFGWESDLLSVNQKGMVWEYEIKVDRKDLDAELRAAKHHHHRTQSKYRRHLILERGPSRFETGCGRPNYFAFAVPEGLCVPEDLPDWAGLVVISKHGIPHDARRPKRLHGQPIDERTRAWLARGLMWRYWNGRKAG